MNVRLVRSRDATKSSLALSLVVHVFVILGIASITFRYPISAFLGLQRDRIPNPETIRYVRVQPRGAQGAGTGAPAKAATPSVRKVNPPPLLAPSTIPSTLPPIPPPTANPGPTPGTGTGAGGALPGVATGVEPQLPDPRLDVQIGKWSFPKSPSQRADSAVRAAFEAYRDAVIAAQEHEGRSPRDWTIERNGQKYGVDSQWVYLGKFKLPSAILAALPFNTGGVDGNRIIENRSADWIRRDIDDHSRAMSEDDFRAAVKRIRQRKERERQEEEKAKEKKPVVAATSPKP
jgi:hypothetical protein